MKKVKKDYIIRTFSDFKRDEKFLIIRHDLDASVEAALDVAYIESKLGIKAIYFVLLHSSWYNLLDIKESAAVKKILNLGHSIGLHFDPEYYDIKKESDLNKYLKLERNFLEGLFDVKIDSFAFHNPTENILRNDKFKYAGMINTYASYFRNEVAYASDSNGHWRYRRLEDVLKTNTGKIQVLTHPIFWQKSIGFPKHKIWNSILGNAERTVNEYDKFLQDNMRINIGELNEEFLVLRKLNKNSGFLAEKYWIRGELESSYLVCWKLLNKYFAKSLKRNKRYAYLVKIKDLCVNQGNINKAKIINAIKQVTSIVKIAKSK